MTSTLPAKSSVRAFFQEMIRNGSYEAFNSNVGCIAKLILQIEREFVKSFPPETLVIIGFYQSGTMSE
jgi:hypothetical protein